jgi:L-fucose isomerase-like protein
MNKIKVAFICFGEVNTPIEVLQKSCEEASNKLRKINLDVIYTGVVTDDPGELEAERAVKRLIFESFEFITICIAGWITSYTVINVLEKLPNKPVLLWGLSGRRVNGKLLTTAAQAGTTALRKVLEDLGYNFEFIYDLPESITDIEKIKRFAKSSKTLDLLKHSKIGMMGFRDMNLYNTLYDGISLKKKLGIEVEFFEMMEIVQLIKKIKDEDLFKVINSIKEDWNFEKPVSDSILKKGAEFYLAIKEKIEERKYQSISLIDVDGMKKIAKFQPAMVFMLLSNKLEICTIPENDTLGAVTQLIVSYLTDQIAAYLEFYEFMEDRVLMGVPDYIPDEVISGNTRVTLAEFGKLEKGLLNISDIKTGKVTLCRISSNGDNYDMHIVGGEAVAPKNWMEVGWGNPSFQLPGLEIIFNVSVKDFAKKVMSQHYIISYGDNTELIIDFCRMAKINVI